MLMLTKKNGNAFMIAIFAMFMIATALMGLLFVSTNALHLNNKQMWGTDAFNVAESGAQVADLWLMKQPIPPAGSNPNVAITGMPITGTLDAGTYSVNIYPDSGNATNFLKAYRILSVGTANGFSKTVEIVVRQSSFGRYAYFTDSEVSSVGGSAIWWKTGDFVDGPVHSNNSGGSNFQINYTSSTTPIFQDIVTAAGTSINYTPSTPNNETTFKKVFLNGSQGYLLGVAPIPLPTSSDTQKNAAWGSSSGYPSGSSGVYLKAGASGGVYIQGDATLTLSVNGSGNQVFTIKQGSNTTTVTLDKTAGTISTSGPMGSGSPTSATTLGTGVIYCEGNITALSGQVADNRVVNNVITTASSFTIATDVTAGKDITIPSSLTYKTKPDKTKGATDPINLAAGTLGLVARNITVASTAPQNIEIDAVCLAGGSSTAGSFGVANYDTKTPTGTLTVLGGLIQKSRGAVGTLNGSTGLISTGYNKDYHYDPRLATNPPPFYPTTGQYERLSWQVLAH